MSQNCGVFAITRHYCSIAMLFYVTPVLYCAVHILYSYHSDPLNITVPYGAIIVPDETVLLWHQCALLTHHSYTYVFTV